jgi:SAM-dependent methyltransferase
MMNMNSPMGNIEPHTVEGFGREWSTYDQSSVTDFELKEMFESYFRIFPLELLDPAKSVGADFGCGSGRWSKIIASRVQALHLIDASGEAVRVAKQNLSGVHNVEFLIEDFSALNIDLDFAFSLGVLHHTPNVSRALSDICTTLKPGAPFLVYLYYALDNRPFTYRLIWKLTNIFRMIISRLPFVGRNLITTIIAALVYWPLARGASLLEKLHLLPNHFPLSFYRHRSFYVMRNDALDRFGTRLELRFSKNKIHELLETSGFEKISFSSKEPFWCAICYKKTIEA